MLSRSVALEILQLEALGALYTDGNEPRSCLSVDFPLLHWGSADLALAGLGSEPAKTPWFG